MNYSQKDFDEIFEAALEDSLAKGLISHAEEFESYIANQEDISNYYVMDKAVIANMIVKVYEDMTAVYESAKVEYAEGEDLDSLGVERGIPRPEASYASAEVTFTTSDILDEDLTIEDEIIVATDNGIEYRTVESIYIPAGEDSATVQCLSVNAGSENKVVENTLINIMSETEDLAYCNNEKGSSGGEDAYTDDEYRYLILNYHQINLKGSNEAYEEFFANYDGIDDYKLIPNWNGITGTMKIIVDPGIPFLLNQLYQEIQTSVCQATEDIFMTAPEEKLIDIYAVVNVDIDMINPFSDVEKENIKSKIIAAIKTFIDGGYLVNGEYYPGLGIGEDFIPHKLAVFVDDEVSELKSITFNYPLNYIEILDEEQGKSNDITIEMV